jgi:hypothetical protein
MSRPLAGPLVAQEAGRETGPCNGSALATKLILQFRPRLVVVVGIAAGLLSGKIEFRSSSSGARRFCLGNHPVGLTLQLLKKLFGGDSIEIHVNECFL